jgi:uncharacterized protein (TIGR00255 family)
MIRSMTGFARRERQGSWGTLAWELRTVNHRYLELSLRMPEDLRSLEGEARTTLTGSLRRGKVDAALSLRSNSVAAPSLELNRPLAAELLRRAEELTSMIGAGVAPPSSLDLLRWPGVVQEAAHDMSVVYDEARGLLAETVADLNDFRVREGGRLRETLRQRCEALLTQVANVRTRLPDVRTRIRARTAERAAQLGVTVAPERLEQEIVLLAVKMDVEEELDRLASHVAEILQVFDSKEPAGRRLDFLMQELNREANTLSSKSQDVETTRAAVDIKVLIEQMREQVQNIE